MFAEISPREVAEAKVVRKHWDLGEDWRVTAGQHYLNEAGEWRTAQRFQFRSELAARAAPARFQFRSEPAARAALAAAQERAGVYSRPEKSTCGCVGTDGGLLETDIFIGHARLSERWEPLCQLDRKYVWLYDKQCRLCVRGVPKATAAPGGEWKVDATPPHEAAPGGEGKGASMTLEVWCNYCQSLTGGRIPTDKVVIPAAELEGLRRDKAAMDVLRSGVVGDLRKEADVWRARKAGHSVPSGPAFPDPADALLAAEGVNDGPA